MSNIVDLSRWPDRTRPKPFGKLGYGYMVDPEDPYHVIPDEKVIPILEQALDYIDNGNSFREVTEWVNVQLSSTMTHVTLRNLYKAHREPFVTRTKKLKPTVRKHKRTTKQKIRLKARMEGARKKLRRLEAKEKWEEENQLPPREKDDTPREQIDLSSFVPKDVVVHFKPNPGPQYDFLTASEQEVLYGGAAGGEPKSWFSASFLSNESK